MIEIYQSIVENLIHKGKRVIGINGVDTSGKNRVRGKSCGVFIR